MNREVLDKWLERSILAVVLVILVLGPLALGAVDTWEFLILQGLTMAVLVLWGVRLWIAPRMQFLWPPICWVVLAFVGYTIYRYATCDIEYIGRRELIRVLVYASLFFAIINNLHRQEFTQVISFTLIGLAMLISCYAIFQFVTKTNRVWLFEGYYPGRGSGTYFSPNHLAGFLGMLLPLALAYTLAGRVRPVTRILLGYSAGVMLVGIGVTLSRGGWVACGLSLICLFAVLTFYRSHRLAAGLMLVVLLGGGFYLVSKAPQLKERLAPINKAKNKEDVLDARAALWEAAWRMWEAHPWIGVGPGHYNYRFAGFRSQEAQLVPDYAHNDYLNTLADWGSVGAGIVMVAVVALFIGVLKSWRYVRRAEVEFKSNHSNKFAFVLGSSMGLLALLAHSVVDFNLQIPANAILAVALAALLSAHWRFATERFWTTARWWNQSLASIALIATLVYLGKQEVRLGREYQYVQQAEKFPTHSTGQIKFLKDAFAVEPANFKTSFSLGELYRMQSLEGGTNYVELANEAMLWYGRSTNANRFEPLSYLNYGMCLDQIDKHQEAETYFHHADEIDPNGFQTAGLTGWHYIQVGNYAAAVPWLERSRRLEWSRENKIAEPLLEIVRDRLSSSLSDRIGTPAEKAPKIEVWTPESPPN